MVTDVGPTQILNLTMEFMVKFKTRKKKTNFVCPFGIPK